MKNKWALIILIIIILAAVFAPLISPFSYEEQNLDRVLMGPNFINFMGTDSLGRDLYSRIVFGSRVSLLVGLFTSIIALIIGVFWGSVSGYVGGRVDNFFMRFFDILQSVPTLVLMILMTVFWSRFKVFEQAHLQSIFEVVMSLSIITWIGIARVVRAQVIEIKAQPYIDAAVALGVKPIGIVLKHILPNILGSLIVLLSFQVPSNIMLESFLSFLGLGLQPPYSSWGVLANEGWRSLRSAPHLIVFPGFVLFITMLCLNYIGDGLRDYLDPKSEIKNF
ncbi:MAG: ABC transporter permease [Oligoflexia bacterium]|nr:ABC transporter permease [Oligoflexia bacterium]